jgi:hypothetical protein
MKCRVLCGAVLTTLALAPAASAECVWVLWVMYHERGARTSDFEVSATYLSFDHCVARLNEQEESARVIKADDVTRDATTRLFIVSKDKDGRYRRRVDWLCTPDTVDPRGPKASGR